MKNFQKISFFFILLIIVMIANISMAYTMQIVKEKSSNGTLVDGQGSIEKKIKKINSDKGEITIQIDLQNLLKETEENSEVVLVLDNSGSMMSAVDDSNTQTRKKVVTEASKNLVNQLVESSNGVKIGITAFSESIDLTQSLTNDVTVLTNALTKYEMLSTGGTDIGSGVEKATQMFTPVCENKIIILFTDGVPSSCRGSSINPIVETKEYLEEVNKDSKIISIISGIFNESVTQIFGTEENPTTDKIYNIEDVDINEILQNTVFSDIMNQVEKPFQDITITDYFPKEILDNFDFIYEENPSFGIVSKEIDKDSRSIAWKIEKLKAGETASFSYKLKLKENVATSILDKTLDTNEKVVLKYTDYLKKEHTLEIDTPSVKLTKEKVDQNISKDNTISNSKIPEAGRWNMGLIIGISIVLFSVLFVCIIKNRDIK